MDLYNRYKDYCPNEIASLPPKIFCEALLVALDLEVECVLCIEFVMRKRRVKKEEVEMKMKEREI